LLPQLTFGYRSQFTDAVLPGGVPPDLYEVMIGADFQTGDPRGNQLGLSGGVGYRTDRPLPKLDGLVFDTAAFYRIRTGGRSGLILLAHFSNNRNYLNWLPIPGFAYFTSLGNRLVLHLGF